MFVSYTSSDEYAPMTGISIYSLLSNNTQTDEITIFLLDLGITDENKKKINGVVSYFGRRIEYIQVNDSVIENYIGAKVPAHYGSLATYARLCAPVMYPKSIHRLIYIDSDMIINGSMEELWNLDMREKIVAAVPEVFDLDTIAGRSGEERRIAKKHEIYFNAGLLLINVENWKKFSFESSVRNAARSMKEFCHKDQSILNNALDNKYLYRLPCKYNFTLHYLPRYLIHSWAKHSHPLAKEEIMEASSHPIVVHYAGDQARPWFIENTSFLSNIYDYYKNKSCFCEQ